MSIFYGEYKVMAKRKQSKLGRSDFAVNEEDKYVAAVSGGAIVAEERLEDDNNVETCEDLTIVAPVKLFLPSATEAMTIPAATALVPSMKTTARRIQLDLDAGCARALLE
ncbi:hypothetical protein DY000_02003356 [Brassica cretica]|uniref:Uncharacterized protein n=1 Tax=Brassica cretica TaxID=69181 RepID=A0ABQ7C593_BRACR|nr:hypothetical protein DY000_02003356 [Brassica cretica]